PGGLVSAGGLPVALMDARNGYEGAAMLSRGARGNSICGLASAKALWLIPAKALPAARAHEWATNLRCVIRFMGEGIIAEVRTAEICGELHWPTWLVPALSGKWNISNCCKSDLLFTLFAKGVT